VCKEIWDHKVCKVLLGRKVIKVFKVYKETLDLKGIKEM
jgi:hypothetical protein